MVYFVGSSKSRVIFNKRFFVLLSFAFSSISLLSLTACSPSSSDSRHSKSITNAYEFSRTAQGFMKLGHRDELKTAIAILNQGVDSFPNSEDLLQYRATAKLLLSDSEGAKQDLLAASKVSHVGETFIDSFYDKFPSKQDAVAIEVEVDELISRDADTPYLDEYLQLNGSGINNAQLSGQTASDKVIVQATAEPASNSGQNCREDIYTKGVLIHGESSSGHLLNNHRMVYFWCLLQETKQLRYQQHLTNQAL